MSYQRVLPRDLFNEAKLLKCIGQLCLHIHNELTPVPMRAHHYCDDSQPGFEIDQLPDAELTVSNLVVWIGDHSPIFKTKYNSKANYPLWVEYNEEDYKVFTDAGEFSEEFITVCRVIKA